MNGARSQRVSSPRGDPFGRTDFCHLLHLLGILIAPLARLSPVARSHSCCLLPVASLFCNPNPRPVLIHVHVHTSMLRVCVPRARLNHIDTTTCRRASARAACSRCNSNTTLRVHLYRVHVHAAPLGSLSHPSGVCIRIVLPGTCADATCSASAKKAAKVTRPVTVRTDNDNDQRACA